ncbi:MAG TPA: hypothetical protein VGZ22_05615 [Isosphaeraceae bacterium]|nr:hypothetical protein [Isosphaeraceae bacterium]
MTSWPGHARYGAQAGQTNESFLNAELFQTHLTERLKPHAERVAALIFEFGTFNKKTVLD